MSAAVSSSSLSRGCVRMFLPSAGHPAALRWSELLPSPLTVDVSGVAVDDSTPGCGTAPKARQRAVTLLGGRDNIAVQMYLAGAGVRGDSLRS